MSYPPNVYLPVLKRHTCSQPVVTYSIGLYMNVVIAFVMIGPFCLTLLVGGDPFQHRCTSFLLSPHSYIIYVSPG